MTNTKGDGKSGQFKLKLLHFWTISRLMSATVALVLLSSSIAASYLALDVILNNKLKDSWAILYINLESLALRTNVFLNQCCTQSSDEKTNRNAIATYKAVKEDDGIVFQKIRGPFSENIKPFELGLGQLPKTGLWHFAQYGEKLIVIRSRGPYLDMWKYSWESWFEKEKSKVGDSKIYMVSRSGVLLYSNDAEINQTTFKRRPLVAEFIKKQVTNLQLEMEDKKEGVIYGFFQEIPGTNLVMFAETAKAKVFAVFWDILGRVMLSLILLIAVSVVLVTIPAAYLLKPIEELSNLAVRIGHGDFSTLPQSRGFGELGPLVESFGAMMANLTARDQAIKKLSADQMQKLRMANELAIAKSLQDNFIKAPNVLELGNGVNYSISYQSAEECAGDWYSVYLDPTTNDITVAIADVSGHGAIALT